MRAGRPVAVVCSTLAAIAALAVLRGEAHKPITSPYTFNEDVYPILRNRCGRCHVSGGAAPMSLMTHQDTVPWSESIRIELIAGHMPPWGAEGHVDRFLYPQSLTARELNVLLTWASGGTPLGSPDKTPAPVEVERSWRLGPPDLVLPLPEFTLTAEKQEETVEVTLATSAPEPRWVRAVDLQPGTPAMVRDARIIVRSPSSEPARASVPVETVLAAWVPGDDVVELERGGAFQLPARAELAVRMHYKKTWQYERDSMTDRSSVGLYFARGPSNALGAIALSAPSDASQLTRDALSFERVVDTDVRAVAIYADPAMSNLNVNVVVARPDAPEEELISFRGQKNWSRRYWFAQPVTLPKGTRITVRVTSDVKAQAIATGTPQARADLSTARLTLNVLPARD